jgi:hypothetical protein
MCLMGDGFGIDDGRALAVLATGAQISARKAAPASAITHDLAENHLLCGNICEASCLHCLRAHRYRPHRGERCRKALSEASHVPLT